MGGACYYVIDSTICDSNILKTFILTKVVPNIRQRIPDSAAIVLGKAVLWLVYSNVSCKFISAAERDRVKTDLADTGIVIVDGQNPIAKVPIIVSGDQGTVYIDELPSLPLPGVDGIVNNDGTALQGLNARTLNRRILENNQASGDKLQNWMLQLQSGFMSLRRENVELRSKIAALTLAMERGFEVMNGNMRRIALQPARQRLATATTAAAGRAATREGTAVTDAAAAGEVALLAPALAMTNPATLMPNPKSLYDLWHEYLHGVGGRKPARLFSETERGQVKFKFTRRKVIWDVVRDLVSLGHSSQRAIDLIYSVYGPQTSVTVIINRLRRDKKNGTINPNLRI